MIQPPPLKPPKELEAIVDVVLAYKVKPKTEPAKKRKKKSAKIAKEKPRNIDLQ